MYAARDSVCVFVTRAAHSPVFHIHPGRVELAVNFAHCVPGLRHRWWDGEGRETVRNGFAKMTHRSCNITLNDWKNKNRTYYKIMESDSRDAPTSAEKTNKGLTGEAGAFCWTGQGEARRLNTCCVTACCDRRSVYRGRPPTCPDDKQTLRTCYFLKSITDIIIKLLSWFPIAMVVWEMRNHGCTKHNPDNLLNIKNAPFIPISQSLRSAYPASSTIETQYLICCSSVFGLSKLLREITGSLTA